MLFSLVEIVGRVEPVRPDRQQAIMLAEMLSILSGWMLCGMYFSIIKIILFEESFSLFLCWQLDQKWNQLLASSLLRLSFHLGEAPKTSKDTRGDAR
jgi:hypothetical protein